MSTETRRNLCPNPNMEVNITGWTGVSGAALSQDATKSHSGTKSCLITHATGGAVVSTASRTFTGLVIGRQYTISAWIYIPTGTNTNGQIWIGGIGAGTIVSVKDQWVRSSKTITATATSHILYIATTGATTAGWLEWFDDVQVEEGSTASEYFDGDTPNTSAYSYEWAGTAGASESFELNLIPGTRRNLCPNPSFETSAASWVLYAGVGGTSTITRIADATSISGGQLLRENWTVAPSSSGGVYTTIGSDAGPDLAGRIHTYSMYVRPSVALTMFVQLQYFKNGAPTGSANGPQFTCPANVWTRVYFTSPALGSGDNKIQARWYIFGTGALVGTNIDFDACLIAETTQLRSYFDGNTADANDGGVRYYFQGALDLSESIEETFTVVRRNKITDPKLVNASGWAGVAGGTGGTVTASFYSPNASALPGDVYTVSVDITATTIAVSGQLSARGTVAGGFGAIPYTSTNWFVPAGQTQRFSHTATIPTGADGLRLYSFVTVTNGSVKIANPLIEKTGSVQPYFDGSFPAVNGMEYLWTGTPDSSESIAVNTLPETRRNLAPNPSAQGITIWGGNSGSGGVSQTNPDVSDGVCNKSYRLTWTANATVDTGGILHGISTSRLILIYPGQILSASMYVKANRTQRIALFWYAYDTANAQKGTGNGAAFILNPNEWTRLTASNFRIPAASDHLMIAAYSLVGTGFSRWVIGDTFEAQGVLVENSDTVNPYFDGDSPAAGTNTYAWSFTKGQSESIAYATSGGSKGDDIFAGLIAAGYGPGSMADMEYKRLLAKNGLTSPQKLSLNDLYSLAGERPRIGAFRK